MLIDPKRKKAGKVGEEIAPEFLRIKGFTIFPGTIGSRALK
jgi:hypothetical protein